MKICQLTKIVSVAVLAIPASAQLTTSPLTGLPYADVPAIGGVVLELQGMSGTSVISYLGVADLFSGGYYDTVKNTIFGLTPQNPAYAATDTIGISSISPAEVASLGVGLSGISVRLTQFDGETGTSGSGPGVNFNVGGVNLGLNGAGLGDFSAVPTTTTDSAGSVLGSSFGFESDALSTGFFVSTDAGELGTVFASIAGGGPLELTYNDISRGLTFIEFRVVPEPSVIGLMGFVGVLALVVTRRRRR